MKLLLPLWQRLAITIVAMLITSYVAGLLWSIVSGWTMPGYISGVIGGLSALPVWELLKRVRPS